jgi:hypothetical protein
MEKRPDLTGLVIITDLDLMPELEHDPRFTNRGDFIDDPNIVMNIAQRNPMTRHHWTL